MFPTESEKFKPLADAAFEQWAPGATLNYKSLKGGRSGSAVLKVDIRGEHGGDIENGQYMLKLSEHSKWPDQESEIDAHKRATDWNQGFAHAHIPTLVKSFNLADDELEGCGYAILYEIAGNSLDVYMAAEGPEIPGFLEVSEKIIKDLLTYWVEQEPREDKRPHQLIESWSSYRLRAEDAPALHAFAQESIGTEITFIAAGEVLINPLKFHKFAEEKQWSERGCLQALLHGDLHGGNVMIPRSIPDNHAYWVIDFALSKAGLAGYDQAYLELSQIIYCIGNNDPAYLIGVLKQLDLPGQKQLLPAGTFWLKQCLQKMREVTTTWRLKVHPRRNDDVIRQFHLARVAAGLNWANNGITRTDKTLSPNQRYISLCYAGWAAREYVKTFEPEDWKAVSSSVFAIAGNEKLTQAASSPADESLWQELWKMVAGYSSKSGRFILISEAQSDDSNLKALGQLPWSAVIDLDPYSDVSGLHRHASPVLQTYRGLHTFSTSFPTIDFNRGTAWMMAAGWDMKREVPTDYENWLWDKLPLIRTFVKTIEDQVNPNPLYVIVLPGGSLDPAVPLGRLAKVISAIHETTRGRATIALLGRNKLPEPVPHEHIPMDVGSFISHVDQTFGSSAHRSTAQIPAGDDEWRSIPIDSLRTMQENFVVLHSGILEEIAEDDRSVRPDTFWRGHPPTWADFKASRDIDRQVNAKLVAALKEELEGFRNHTVLLNHTPGSGGTTTALRAAWDLHEEFPVAVLTHWSTALAIRIENLYRIAQKPVLLVAEASSLNETAREDLYRELAKRNVRTVLLYVRRVFRTDDSLGLTVTDPMSSKEAKDFYKAYAALNTDEERRKELLKITKDKELIRYRTPFFYGLITWERDFQSIEKYVTTHIRGARGKVRELLEYLAFVTIYSDTGIHEVLLRRLMGLRGDVEFKLTELLGEGPARLVTSRQGSLRLMHQVIAEEVLKHTIGAGADDWKLELHQLATDFIRDVASCVNPHSLTVLDLFRQIYTERPGRSIDGVEDRKNFSPLIEDIDDISGPSLGHSVLNTLTEFCPNGDHFWSHLGRHQIYRLRRDPDKAEEYLRHAIALSPKDYIHYHTLGLIERYRVRETLRDFKDKTAIEILSAASEHFESAVEAFEKSRSINPENIYGHITQVQTILEVAERLKRSSGVENIAQINVKDPIIVEWLETNIAIAERLLNDTQQLYGTLDQEDSYLTSCYAALEKLYGDIDEVIRLWEIAVDRGPGTAISRRALANAYLARNDRHWSTMQHSELQRIVDLTEPNLRSSGRRDEDYRLWFEAYKLLPEFDVDEAISKLNLWTSHFPTWRAYYYLYVLHYFLWFSGRTNSLNEMDECLEKCKKFHFGRRNLSPQWLGYKPSACPLIADVDLGEWNKKSVFWENISELRRINGVIDDIQGPQAGWIKIDGKVRAFFVPAKRKDPEGKSSFYEEKDENIPVNFFVGFSPEGLRAWSVERGGLENGDRVPFGQPEPVWSTAPIISAAVSDNIKYERAKSLKLSRVLEFIEDLVRIKTTLGADLTLTELEDRTEATFGIDGLVAQLGFENLPHLLQDQQAYKLTRNGSELLITMPELQGLLEDKGARIPLRETAFGQIIRLHESNNFGFLDDGSGEDTYFNKDFIFPADRSKLKGRGQLVEFTPDTNDRGAIAVGIRILDESLTLADQKIIPPTALREAVKTEVLRMLNEAGTGDKFISLDEMKRSLSLRFRGFGPLADRLKVNRLQDFLRKISGVELAGEPANRVVRFTQQRAFGRLSRNSAPPVSKALSAEAKTTADKPLTETQPELSKEQLIREATSIAIDTVRQGKRAGEEIRVSRVSARINKELHPKGRLAPRLGFKSMVVFLRTIAELEVYGNDPTNQYVRMSKEGSPSKPHGSKASTVANRKELTSNSASERQHLVTKAKSIALSVVSELEAQGKLARTDFVARKIAEKIPGVGNIGMRLGYASSVKLLSDIPELEIYKKGYGTFVRTQREKIESAATIDRSED